MKLQHRNLVMASILLIWSAGTFRWPVSTTQAAPLEREPSATVPVEPDMHEFMEYVFQPTFKRLSPAMATAPANNSAWKVIKADSLILAEGGNLLLDRQPRDHAADWVKHSRDVREFGGQLYRAAKAKDYAGARTQYESMVKSCNACHQQFADGKHILAP